MAPPDTDPRITVGLGKDVPVWPPAAAALTVAAGVLAGHAFGTRSWFPSWLTESVVDVVARWGGRGVEAGRGRWRQGWWEKMG